MLSASARHHRRDNNKNEAQPDQPARNGDMREAMRELAFCAWHLLVCSRIDEREENRLGGMKIAAGERCLLHN